MRFSDIKKFWETRLGGQSSKSSQPAGNASMKNSRKTSSSFPTKSYSFVANKKSVNEPSEQTDAAHAREKTSEDSILHDDRNVLISAVGTNKDDACLSIQEPTMNGLKTEDNRKSIGAIYSSRESSEKKKRSSFTSALHAFNRKASGKLVTKRTNQNDLEPEKFTITERLTSLSVDSSPTKVSFSKKAKLDSKFISSDQHLEEVSTRLTLRSRIDSTSAPASVSNSPRKAMQVADTSRYHSRSNDKFNEVQSFWMMREKKLCERSVDERRCVDCGCFLTNYFYEFDEALYCEEDYWNKYGHSCKKCCGIITGPIIIAGQHRFHPECFSCKCCKRCISDGDLYTLLLADSKQDPQIEETALFCLCCYEGLLSDYSPHLSDENTVVHCTVIQVITFIPGAADVIPSEQDAESSKQQACAKGYGLVLKSVPMDLSTDGSNQPVGQVVCEISEKDSCLKKGDILLQINGLTVDSNALELIERLDDDNAKPLLLTIQRSVARSAKMMRFEPRDCSHLKLADQMAKDDLTKVSDISKQHLLDDENESSRGTEGRMSLSSISAIDDQPRSPIVAVDDQPKISTLSAANADLKSPMPNELNNSELNDAAPLYCGPFSPFVSQSLCCDTIPAHEINSKVVEAENKLIDEATVGGAGYTDTANSTLTDSGYATNSDSFSPRLASDVENDNRFASDRSRNTFSIISVANDEIINLEARRRSNISIAVSDTSVSRRSSNCIENSSIIYEDDSVSLASTVFSTNCENENRVETTKNSLETLSRISTPKNSFTDDSVSENASPISPRTKRLAIKRKSLTVNEHDDQQAASSSERLKIEPMRTSSLRSNVSVTMRRLAPRSGPQSPRILSVYNTDHVRDLGGDLNRSESMRVHGLQMGKCLRVFRPCDLIHGEVLGQGFFGKAIKVTHRDTGEVMVLKILNSLDDEVEKSFLKEVKVMRKLVHRNVIHFIGVLYKDRRLNIITEFVENGTLKDVITNMEQELTWPKRVHIARDISSGMSYLHSKHLIHRDLNSGNCFVKKDGTVVVADFGLARVYSKAASLGRRKRYTVVGNPFWMAPEMLHGSYYDERVDIFSFGIVLCEVIGRIDADPDFLPRANDFGLAVTAFYEKFCQHCPAFYFALAVQCSSLNANDRPSFQVVEEWFQMLTFREELCRLPEPPNLHNVIVSVYLKYNLTLPPNLYYPFMKIQSGPQVPRNLHNRPSSPKSVESDRTPSDTDVESDLVTNDFTSPLKSSVRGTEFFSDSSIVSRL